jgi:hypothetical protein
VGKAAEGLTDAADKAATEAHAATMARTADLKNIVDDITTARSGLGGKLNEALDLFGKGPLPDLMSRGREAYDDLMAAKGFEKDAAESAKNLHSALDPVSSMGKLFPKAIKATLWGTNVTLGAMGLANSNAGVTPTHSPWGVVKNVVVNSTVADVRAIEPAAESALLKYANYVSHDNG